MLLLVEPYKLPRLIDINVSSKIIRSKRKLLVVGRCIEIEKPWALGRFNENEYAIVSVCLEEHHVNHVGFKLASMIARNDFEEVSVLTTDGSMHCIQLHYMVEEVFKFTKTSAKRRHFITVDREVVEVPPEVVKLSRFLHKVKRLMEQSSSPP